MTTCAHLSITYALQGDQLVSTCFLCGISPVQTKDPVKNNIYIDDKYQFTYMGAMKDLIGTEIKWNIPRYFFKKPYDETFPSRYLYSKEKAHDGSSYYFWEAR